MPDDLFHQVYGYESESASSAAEGVKAEPPDEWTFTRPIRDEEAPDLLRATRKKLKLTQTAFAKKLGVAPNTVARWEREELPIPQTIRQLLRLQYTVGKHRRAARIASQRITHLENELRKIQKDKKTAERRERYGTSKAGKPADTVFRALARKYHPDLNPQHAEVMRDINELYQAMKAKR